MRYLNQAVLALGLLIAIAAGCGGGGGSVPAAAAPADSVLMFAFFRGNGEEGLFLAWSEDGLAWEEVPGGPFLRPTVGNERLMRDPCILPGPDGTFHLVWTTSGQDRAIGYASSTDLAHWSAQHELPVMMHEPQARNCWAPELFLDQERGLFYLYWSSTVTGSCPDSTASEEGYNHRLFFTATHDFRMLTPSALFYDPGFNCIDGTLVRVSADRLALFFKDERLTPPQKNIRVAFGSAPDGIFGPASEPITGDCWAEGPTVIRIGGRWHLYYDCYQEGRYGAAVSDDLEHWEDRSDRVSFPPGARHGTVFRAPRPVLRALLGAGDTGR